MAIEFEGKRYDADWNEIDPMGNRIRGQKDWRANADWASKTGGQNPYSNAPGSSPYDTTGLIPGNEPGSTLPKGPSTGWLDQAKMAAYRLSQTMPRPTSPSTPYSPFQQGTPQKESPSASSGSGGPSPAPYTGFTPQHDYSAFNTARQQDPGKSAKDAFAMLSNQAPAPPFHDRAALMAWFNQHIAPGMNALGHRVISASDDGFVFSNHEGTFFVDYAQNAGAAPGSMLQRLQWNASPHDDATRQRYAGGSEGSTPPGGSPPPGGGGGPQITPPPQPQRQPVSFSMGGPGNYQDLNWWNQQGVPVSDIFDPSGQLKPEWVRTPLGYERSGASASSAGTPGFSPVTLPPLNRHIGQYLNFDADTQQMIARWYVQYLGRTPGIDDFMAHAGNPNGLPGIELAIRESPEAREYAARRPTTPPPTTTVPPPTNPNTPTGGGGGVGSGVQLPGNQYSDEYTRLLEELAKSRIGSLQNPINDPFRNQYTQGLQGRANTLGAGSEPEYQQLLRRLGDRFNELKGPGFTGAENEILRTQALDPIERDRTAAKQRALERISARGLTPDSGVAQQLLQEIDNEFDAMRAGAQRDIALYDMNRREDRNQRADALAGALYEIPNARALERLDVFSGLEGIEMLARSEEAARAREQLSLAGVLADLGPNRLQLAMQAAGMAGNYAPLSNTLMSLAALNQQQALLTMQQRSTWLRGIGSVLGYLSRAGL